MALQRIYRPSRILAYPGGPTVLGKSEQRVALQLKEAGVSFDYESERIPYRIERDVFYRPDFRLSNGIIVEVKGWFTSEDRMTHLRVQKQHPTLDVRFIFDNPNKPINKGSKTSYAQWCEKHGFLWSTKEIPIEWLMNQPS